MRKLALLFMLLLPGAHLGAAPLVFASEGTVGQTGVASASLNGLGLTTVASVTISDNNAGTAGSAGIFSGFDLDMVFIDLDGALATSGDRVFGSAFIFTTGTVRPTADPGLLPTLAHPGPTFGSLALNTIDGATATLNALDAVFGSPLNTTSSGYLTLGDGGTLVVGFGAGVVLGLGTERLFIGEVGGNGEIAEAAATASDQRIPLPGTLALLALGVLGLGVTRRGLPAQR
jgi:hypothetical protein